MSRIGKLPINIPENVNINYVNSEMIVKGKFGELKLNIPDAINITQNDGELKVSLKEEKKDIKALHGLYRTLINNMILGVSKQFDITLILKGVGYRGAVQGNTLSRLLFLFGPQLFKVMN